MTKSGLREAGMLADIWIGSASKVIQALVEAAADVDFTTEMFRIEGPEIQYFMKDGSEKHHDIVEIHPETMFFMAGRWLKLVEYLRWRDKKELEFRVFGLPIAQPKLKAKC